MHPPTYAFLRSNCVAAGIIGGAKWEGKKTVIEDDEPTEQGTQTACEGSPAVDEAPSSPAAAPAKSFKYAKIVRKLLRQVRVVRS